MADTITPTTGSTMTPNTSGNPTDPGYMPSNMGNSNIGVSTTINPPSGFSINTNNLTSADLAGNNTPSTVMNYRNVLQGMYDQNNPYAINYSQYLTNALPAQYALASYTAFSPEELAARQRVLDLNQGVRSATNNILGRTEPVEFQQGQQAALQRDYGLQISGANDTLNNLEGIRQNNIAVATALLAQNQANFTNQQGAIEKAQNAGISAAQVGNQAQQVAQGRYDFQQITDPQTGFPVIQVIDKTTGQAITKIDPNSSAGQAITQTGLVTTPTTPTTPSTTTTGITPATGNIPQQNNNPGNLKDPTTGQFRIFATPQEG